MANVQPRHLASASRGLGDNGEANLRKWYRWQRGWHTQSSERRCTRGGSALSSTNPGLEAFPSIYTFYFSVTSTLQSKEETSCCSCKVSVRPPSLLLFFFFFFFSDCGAAVPTASRRHCAFPCKAIITRVELLTVIIKACA